MAPTRKRPQPYRILVVEDDDAFVAVLTELLEAAGRFEVVARARDGREAVKLARTCGADVVLMDVELPGLDGVEATRRIRRRKQAPPVVAITGWEYEERALEIREAGAVDFVRKARLDADLADALLAAAQG